MIYLDTPNRKIQIVLGAAITTNQLEITTHFYDTTPQATTTVIRGGSKLSNSNDTTDVDIVEAPALQGIIRNVHTITVHNKDTVLSTVSVKIDDGGTEKILVKMTIASGDTLTYDDGFGWQVSSPVAEIPVPYAPLNFGLDFTAASNILTVTLTTADGGVPSASNPVRVPFTASGGRVQWLGIQETKTLTVSSGSTLGTSSGVSFKLWVVLLATGLRAGDLAIINCLSGTSVFPLGEITDNLNVTSEGGAGAADSAHVLYCSDGSGSDVQGHIVGWAEWPNGVSTAGNWTAPTRSGFHYPGGPVPGQVVQSACKSDGAVATGTTTLPLDDSIPQNTEGDEYMTQAITPTSGMNVFEIEHQGNYAFSSSSGSMSVALFQSTSADAIAAAHISRNAGADSIAAGALRHRMKSGTTLAITFQIRAGSTAAGTTTFNGQAGARTFGGVGISTLVIREIAA